MKCLKGILVTWYDIFFNLLMQIVVLVNEVVVYIECTNFECHRVLIILIGCTPKIRVLIIGSYIAIIYF